MLSYSRGRNINDNHPQQVEVAGFEEFAAALDADRAPAKAGAAYVCGPLNGEGRRCAEGAMPRAWLAVDLDRIEAERLPDVRMKFAGFSGCAWPTHSSKPDAPRERVIVELDRPADRAECIEVGRVLMHDLTTEFGDAVLLDDSTFRPEQPVFVPPTGATLARFFGEPLCVDAYLQAARELPQNAPERPTTAHDRAAGDGDGRRVAEGGRNAMLSREAYRLRKQGQTVEQIATVLLAMNGAMCEPPLPEAEVRNIAAGKRAVAPEAGKEPGMAGNEPHPWLRFLAFDDSATLRAPEFVLDDVMAAGQVVLTGDRGAGKSTLGASFAMLAAHLCARDHPLRPTLRRNVIYIAEDPAQVQWIIRAKLRREGEARGGFYAADVRERIKFVRAVALHADTLDGIAAQLDPLRVTNHAQSGATFDAMPLVILDTRSACVAVADENDNAEASAALQYLRRFVPVPTMLISHPPKGNKGTTRGAGAWEADAHQVIYLSLDPETRVRTVHLAADRDREAKRRFESAIDSLLVSSDVVTFEALDPLGQTVETRVRYCDVTPERSGEKDARQTDEQITRTLRAVQQGALSASAVQEALGIKRQKAQELVRLCVESGWLERVAVPSGSRKAEPLKLTLSGARRLAA